MLDVFAKARLVDPYDVYQHLMDYWAETMQDDVYMIVSDGWQAAVKPQLIVEDKAKKTKEKPDITIGKQKYKAELAPPALLIARYFEKEQSAIDEQDAEAARIAQTLEELKDEHSGEEGLLEEVLDDKGKITRAAVTARLNQIDGEQDFADEQAMLDKYLALLDEESAAEKKVKDLKKDLDKLVFAKYPKLSEDEVKTLVVDDKWLAKLAADVQGELDRISQTLTGRVKQLAERYATPLPKLDEEIETMSARVAAISRRWGLYGIEARLQANRRGCNP